MIHDATTLAIHNAAATPIPNIPPVRRIDRRVAATPPGNAARRVDGVRVLTLSSYVASRRQPLHLFATSSRASLLAVLLWMTTLLGEKLPRLANLRFVAVIVLIVLMIALRQSRYLVMVAACVAGASGGAAAWTMPRIDDVASCAGVARLQTDPVPLFGGTQVVLHMNGVRWKSLAHGTAASRLARRSAGEFVAVRGTCSPLSGDYSRSEYVRHIVGALAVEEVSELFSEGTIVMRTANRMRSAMQSGVSKMDFKTKSLFTGLVIGDDRLQPREMVQRFRDSGLSHLCAASGQNVAYLLAVVAPFMRRRNARVKWLITMAIIGWFIVLTRGEPSVLRAGFMAAAVATNSFRQSAMNARVVLAISVMALLLIDPMLAWSVGFALSVGATAGLAWLSAPLGRIFGGRGVLASTLAAQIGTFPISLMVFGSVPVISLVANPLALPVAGLVMTVGLPVSLCAALFPGLVGLVSTLMSLPVMWVDAVATVASRISPVGGLNSVLWLVVGCCVALRWHSKRGRRLTAVAG